MNEHKGIITIKGEPLTLVGNEIQVGDKAPDVELINNDLKPVQLSSYLDNICIILTVPSLDTPVCDIETRRFNKEAANLGNNIKVIAVSMDLPFAQKRWCGAADIKNVTTLSDHRSSSFGNSFGVLIKELNLLSRCVFIIDNTGTVTYKQMVKEITNEPNYEAVLNEIRKGK
ncbi:MAG: thiol peroxidase [Deltaproteobacteria bacterium CG07_land_8_20_14_0_80_38_7]|nr:MAG: thiol peroxidase [Deltaproteobacteria bacterium CG07_land_8_20_14_0_80_38_7]